MTHSSENRPNYWNDTRDYYERTKEPGAPAWDDLPVIQQQHFFMRHFEDRDKPIACQE